MYFKKKIFAYYILLILFTLNFNLPAINNEILVDKIIAVVGDTVISFSDIEKAVLLYPILRNNDESEIKFYKQILNELIDYRVIYLEYGNEIILNENDFEKIELEIIEKSGSFQKLNKILDSFDMTWQNFRVFIKERVFFEKTIREKFQFKISITFNDVKDFYKKEYVPNQKKLNLVPKSLIAMTPKIENHLRQIETGKKIKSWLKDIRDNYKIRILSKII